MNIKKLISMLMMAVVITTFAAVPEVTDVTAKQRFPWNGLVDITCKVTGINGTTNGLKFAVAAVMPDSGNVRTLYNFWVVQNGTNSTDRKVHTNGDYHLLWDAQAELGQVIYSNMVMRVTVVELHDKVQLWKGGPYWSDTNIGAENPEDYGYYFWWGDIVGYKRENDAWVASDGSSSNFSFIESNTPTYYKSIATLKSEGWITADEVLVPEHDAAHVQWDGSWRMPTTWELSDLNSKCDWTWTTQNGVYGYVVRGRGDYASNSIFLPCAGYGEGPSHIYAGSRGDYWSSGLSVQSLDSYGFACYLCFHSSYGDTFFYYPSNHDTYYGGSRFLGRSVRPVQGFTEAVGQAVGQAGDSASFRLDTVTPATSPEVDSLSISWDATWSGGDENATVVIRDNGLEVKRATGRGVFEHVLSGAGWHELTYTTYVGDVAKDDVYAVTLYTLDSETVGDYTWSFHPKDNYVVVDRGGRAYAAISPQPDGFVEIPVQLGGKPVMEIGDWAFTECVALTGVTIPDGVTSIGEWTFNECVSLTSVTIPDGVTSIGEGAFYRCSGLTSVTIPASVTNIGSFAFSGCDGLKDVTLPSRWALSSIFPSAYSSITNVTVLSGASGIPNSAFKGCGALTSISIPDTVTSIGDEAFYNCTSLEHLAIPDSVTSYGANCFERCPALYRAVFGGGVGGGSASVVTTVVQQVSTTVVQEVESPYALTNAVADRAIASVTVNSDCAIDRFVLKDGKVYDTMLRVVNTADHEVHLTLPAGYEYETFEGVDPLTIPANSRNMLSITRTADNTFLVSREKLKTIR